MALRLKTLTRRKRLTSVSPVSAIGVPPKGDGSALDGTAVKARLRRRNKSTLQIGVVS